MPNAVSAHGSHRRQWRTGLIAIAAVLATVATSAVIVSSTADAAITWTHRYQFGPAKATPVRGYALDNGSAYKPRRGHGWQTQSGVPVNMTWATRTRATGTSLQRNLITASKNGRGVVWHLNIANGTYSVTVGVGDPSYADGRYRVTVNGKALISKFVPTASHHFTSGTTNVTVAHGKMLFSTAGGTRTKLNYVVIGAANSGKGSPAHLVWMYNAPSARNMSTVVGNFDTFIVGASQQTLINRLRAAKRTAHLYQYFLLNQVVKPPAGQAEYHNNAAYRRGDFAWMWRYHRDWFMHDSRGRVIVDKGTYYRMDPANPHWRAFWLSRVKAASVNWGGVFADNVDVSLCGLDKQGRYIPRYRSDTSYTNAMAGFLRYAWTRYFARSGKALMLNLTNSCSGRNMAAKYAAYTNFNFNEGWAVDWHTGYLGINTWNAQLAAVESASARGHGSVLAAQGDRTNYRRQQFAYASYLLVVQPNVTFRYTQYQHDGYDKAWLYPDYRARLGIPLSKRYRLRDGVSWRRDFTNGWVSVNPVAHVSKISVNR